MNKYILIITCFFTINITAQTASDYFPGDTGFNWEFVSYGLDINNQQVDTTRSEDYHEYIDNQTIGGRDARIIGIRFAEELQFSDSSFVSLEGQMAYEYLKASSFLDTSFTNDPLFSSFAGSLAGWYPLYDFSEALNTPREIINRDTTININNLDVELSIVATIERKGNDPVDVPHGSYNAEKFELHFDLNAETQTPFGPITIDIIDVSWSKWLFEGLWVIKEYRPTVVTADMSLLGIPPIEVSGLNRELENISVTDIKEPLPIAGEFQLFQNYPNPFNPETVISYQLAVNSFIKLHVYDLLGKKVEILVEKEQTAGLHTIQFDASAFPSGIYFYKLETNSGFISTKKMMLLK